MYKVGFKEIEEPEIKLPTFIGSWRNQDNSRKKIYLCFTDYTKAFDCVDHNKLRKILKEMEMSDHLICLLRNLNAGQEGKVKTLVAQTVKNLPVIWETRAQFLVREDSMEKEMQTHSITLAWEIP